MADPFSRAIPWSERAALWDAKYLALVVGVLVPNLQKAKTLCDDALQKYDESESRENVTRARDVAAAINEAVVALVEFLGWFNPDHSCHVSAAFCDARVAMWGATESIRTDMDNIIVDLTSFQTYCAAPLGRDETVVGLRVKLRCTLNWTRADLVHAQRRVELHAARVRKEFESCIAQN